LFMVACDNSSSSSIDPIKIVELDVEPKISTLNVGTSERYRAIATYSDGVVADVSDQVLWSLENQSGIVESIEDPDYPEFLFALAVKAGEDNIVATIGGISSRSAVTVVDTQLVELVVSPKDADLSVGTEETFVAEGEYDDGHKQDLTDESDWVSSNSDIVSISEDGIAMGELAGTATITASIDGLSDSADVTVHDLVEIESIDVGPQDVLLYIDGSQQFNAYAHYSDGSIQTITKSVGWYSSDTSVAAQDNFRKGFFHAKSEGVAEITAYFNINYQGTSTITVEQVVLTGIVISPRDYTLAVGETKRYFTEATASDGSLISVNQSPNQSYSVDDPSIAYISNNPDNKGELIGLESGTTTVNSTFVYEGETYTTQTTVTITP